MDENPAAEMAVSGIKMSIPESDEINSSEVPKLSIKRARYLDMSIQDWSEANSSAANSSVANSSAGGSKETGSIENSPKSEGADLPKKDLFESDPLELGSIKTKSLEIDSFKAESFEIDPIEVDSYKKEPIETNTLETNTLETDALQRTYSLFTQGLEIDQIAEIQGMSTEEIFRHFEQLILAGKVRDIEGLLPPKKQRQIRAALEVLETELDSLIRARIGGECQEEELKFVRALLLSKTYFSKS